MFTGLVSDVGTVVEVGDHQGSLRHLRIASAYDPATIPLGASIACSGPCLTVVAIEPRDGGGCIFAVDAAAETLARTTVGGWQVGTKVNLERSMKIGDELGGHIVSGHVDGVAEIVAMEAEGASTRFTFRAPEALAGFIAPKGSVALNGTSLTVNEVTGAEFGVNIIPHTKEVTTWGQARVGDRVNIEIDTLARYVARLREWSGT